MSHRAGEKSNLTAVLETCSRNRNVPLAADMQSGFITLSKHKHTPQCRVRLRGVEK